MLNFSLTVVQQIAILALQLGTIIFAAKFCGDLAKKLKSPSVLGELLAGVIIGPYLLGGISIPLHGLEHGLFGFAQTVQLAGDSIIGDAKIINVTFPAYHSSLYALATIGSILLLFMSGLETDLRMFFRYSLVGTLVGIGGVIFSFLFGASVGVFLLPEATGGNFMHPCSLFLGILCTATSVGITARILSEKKKIDTPEGVTTLAAAVIDDVLGIICLAIVMGLATVPAGGETDWGKIGLISAKCIGFWLLATAVGLLLATKIAKFLKLFKSATVFSTLAFGLALFLAGIFEQQGLAMIIGAYVMGLSLSKTDISFALQRSLHPLYNFLVPVFFVVMGMLVDIRVFADMNVLKIGAIYSLLAILAKIIGCALPALFMNFNMLGALRIGTGMVPRGEVALIIAGIGMTTMYEGKPILGSELFGVAIIMTLVTTIVAPPLLSAVLGLRGKGVRKETKDMSVIHTPYSFHSQILADFVLRQLIDTFSTEGYMLSQLDKESGVMQIRKDELSFAMTVSGTDIIFESNPDEVPFIQATMFEAIVSLHMDLEKLKNIASPAELRQDYFTKNQEFAPENRRRMKNLLARSLQPAAIIMDLQAEDKPEVIDELIDALDKCGVLKDRDACLCEVLQRECVASTCMQNGIALPHARTDAVKFTSIAIGISKKGYDFDSLDGEKTRIFILCLSPMQANAPHIECLAAISSILTDPEKLQKILNASSAKEIRELFIH
ncbi:MAG: cation:proton antiporter [Lentisphaeria bacterium]|nr:cation:proton antiporter [Lentisphaeria bacterium]